MNKNESRYFHTAIKMDEALITLLENKDFEYITVKELCATAGVNRSTFYLHYENTSDLLKETVRYILDKHFSYYSADTKSISEHFENCERKELFFITSEYLAPYLTFIKENKRIFRVSIKQFHSLHMDEVYGQMFKHIFDPILARFYIPKEERVYIIKFYLTGVFGVIMEWLNRDCVDSMDAVIKIITDCVIGGRKINE